MFILVLGKRGIVGIVLNPEVLELGAPAEHATLADHEHALPGEELLPPETLFGGQR